MLDFVETSDARNPHTTFCVVNIRMSHATSGNIGNEEVCHYCSVRNEELEMAPPHTQVSSFLYVTCNMQAIHWADIPFWAKAERNEGNEGRKPGTIVDGGGSMSLIALLLSTIYAAYTVLLVGILAGRPWLFFSYETTLSKVVPTIALTAYVLSQGVAWEACESAARPVAGAWFISSKVPTEVVEVMSTPMLLFGALFVQGMMQVASARKSSQPRIVAPALVVHVLTTGYYAGQAYMPSCELACRWPLASTGINPLHYALWQSSVSSQVMTIFGLSRDLIPPTRAAASSVVATRSQCRVCVALLGVEAMLLLGAFSDAYHGGPLLAVASMALSFAAFYVLLGAGIYLPLAEVYRHEARSDEPQRRQRASIYRAVCAYLVLAWHGFPAVWMANVLGKAPPRQIEVGYVVCDVLAKFLPPSLYLAVATG